MLSLNSVATALNGKVRGNHVTCPGPEAEFKKGWKRKRGTLSVFINGDDIGVNCHHRDHGDPIHVKDLVRARLGLESWKPRHRKARDYDPIPFKTRNMFVGEDLSLVRDNGGGNVEQFKLLVNDLLRPATEVNKTWARWYGSELFKLDKDTIEKAIEAVLAQQWTDKRGNRRKGPRNYTADKRALIWGGVTYHQRQRLGLRRTGSIDVDKAGRERARRDRYNETRRAKRKKEQLWRKGRKRVCGVNRCPPSSERVLDSSTCEIPSKNPRNQSQIIKNPQNRLRKRRKPPKTAPPPCPESVPFDERVRLMMEHCAMGRAEAELEAMKWEALGAGVTF